MAADVTFLTPSMPYCPLLFGNIFSAVQTDGFLFLCVWDDSYVKSSAVWAYTISCPCLLIIYHICCPFIGGEIPRFLNLSRRGRCIMEMYYISRTCLVKGEMFRSSFVSQSPVPASQRA